MANWEQRFYGLFAEYLREEHKLDCVEVTGFEDDAYDSHGCETCGDDGVQIEAIIYYTDSQGRNRSYELSEGLANFMRHL